MHERWLLKQNFPIGSPRYGVQRLFILLDFDCNELSFGSSDAVVYDGRAWKVW